MKLTISATLLSLSLGMSGAALAGDRTVTVEIGNPASNALQAMAEGGDLTGLIDEVEAAGGNFVENPATGTLAPGFSATATLEVGSRTRRLSVAAMLLPTNDGFVALNGVPIPRWPGVYTFYLKGYDAGTEANDELITGGGTPGAAGIPADPGKNEGENGTGVAGPDHNPTVHVHRGVVGDLDPTGGPSDLNAGVHRWLNPVAKVTVTVGRKGRY